MGIKSVLRGDLGNSVAAIVAMAPGFVLPFVVTLLNTSEESDVALLSFSILSLLVNVVTYVIELNTVSEYGRALGIGGAPDPLVMRSYRRRALRYGYLALGVIGPLMIFLYSFGIGWSLDFVLMSVLVMCVSVVGVHSSTYAGQLVALGWSVTPVATQFFRTAAPILVLVAVPGIWLIWLPVASLAGEFVRYLILKREVAALVAGTAQGPAREMRTSGMIWQSVWATTTQGAPATDRLFLAVAPTGSISSYELADKLFFAALQFINYGFLIRRVGRWSHLPGAPLSRVRKELRNDGLVLLCLALGIAILTAIPLVAILVVIEVNSIWTTAIHWSLFLLPSLPLTVFASISSRLLVIGRWQRVLAQTSVVTVGINLALNVVLFPIFGAFGVVLATLGTKIVQTVVYTLVLRRLIPSLAREGS